jgi:hypothetical protein
MSIVSVVKRTLIFAAGLCWIGAAAGIAMFAVAYLIGGAGLQLLGPFGFSVSTTSVGIGLVHFLGLSAGAFLCFVIGVGLSVHAIVPSPTSNPHPNDSGIPAS